MSAAMTGALPSSTSANCAKWRKCLKSFFLRQVEKEGADQLLGNLVSTGVEEVRGERRAGKLLVLQHLHLTAPARGWIARHRFTGIRPLQIIFLDRASRLLSRPPDLARV